MNKTDEVLTDMDHTIIAMPDGQEKELLRHWFQKFNEACYADYFEHERKMEKLSLIPLK